MKYSVTFDKIDPGNAAHQGEETREIATVQKLWALFVAWVNAVNMMDGQPGRSFNFLVEAIPEAIPEASPENNGHLEG